MIALPFGPYRSLPIAGVPSHALDRALGRRDLGPALATEIRDELQRRRLADVLARWFAEMRERHRDNPEAWFALLESRDVLEEMLKAEGLRR